MFFPANLSAGTEETKSNTTKATILHVHYDTIRRKDTKN